VIDYKGFIEDNFLILDYQSQQPVPFKFKPVQEKYYKVLKNEYGDLNGTREILLKARQEGFSSFILALFTVDFIFIPYSVSICISHRKDATELLFKKVKFYLESYCQKNGMDIKDYLITDNKGIIESRHKHSIFYIATAGAKVGGRGASVRNIHFSECFAGDQLVILQDGFIKKIKDLKEGDPIVLGNGKVGNIIQLQKKKSSSPMKRISCYGNTHFPIECTNDHLILCSDKEEKMQIGSDGKIKHRSSTFAKPIWKKAGEVEVGDYVAFPSNLIRSDVRKKYIDGILITPELSELIGWYLAEGSLNKGRIDLSIHQNEFPLLKNLIEKLKFSYSIYHRKSDGKGLVIAIFSSKLALIIEKYFGRVDFKKIPEFFRDTNKENVQSLIRGLVKGDGAFYPDKIVYVSSRPQLAIQLKRLLIDLKIAYPTIEKHKPLRGSINYFGNPIIGKKDIWHLIISGDSVRKFHNEILGENIKKKAHKLNRRWKASSNYYWMRVASVKDIPKEEFVYDVVLDQEPHSFCVISGIVHNCAFYMDTEIITASEIVEATAQQVPPSKGMIFIESTANGVDNFYQKEWERAQNFDKNGKRLSTYHPRFFGWQEFYSKEWVEKKRGDFSSEAKWLQEYPGDPNQAFIASGTPFFDNLILEEMKKNAPEILQSGRLAPDGNWI